MDRFDWLELDRVTEAQPEGTFPLRRAPSDGPSFHRAAREMREHGYLKTSADFYRRAIGFNDQNYDAWMELIDTMVRLKALDKADAISKEAVENYGLFRPFYASRALVFAHRGFVDEALALSDVSLDTESPHWYAHCTRGELVLLDDPDQRQEALAHYEAAFEVAPDRWEPFWLAGQAFLSRRMPAIAAGMFAEAAHMNPGAPVCWLGLGDSFLALRLYDQALFYYQRVTELNPRHAQALERQRRCAPLPYGLLHALSPRLLQARWKKNFLRVVAKWRPNR